MTADLLVPTLRVHDLSPSTPRFCDSYSRKWWAGHRPDPPKTQPFHQRSLHPRQRDRYWHSRRRSCTDQYIALERVSGLLLQHFAAQERWRIVLVLRRFWPGGGWWLPCWLWWIYLKRSGYFSATAGGTHEDLQYYEL